MTPWTPISKLKPEQIKPGLLLSLNGPPYQNSDELYLILCADSSTIRVHPVGNPRDLKWWSIRACIAHGDCVGTKLCLCPKENT